MKPSEKWWYVVGRDAAGEQLAYEIPGDTPDQAKANFAKEYPDLTFVNIF